MVLKKRNPPTPASEGGGQPANPSGEASPQNPQPTQGTQTQTQQGSASGGEGGGQPQNPSQQQQPSQGGEGGGNVYDETIKALRTEIDELKRNQQQGPSYAMPSQQTPQAPQPQAPRDYNQEVADIDGEIDKLEDKLDEALHSSNFEKGEIKKLQRDIRQKERKRDDLLRERDIGQLQAFGEQSLSQISERVTKSDMPYLSIPEVKQLYDQTLQSVGSQARANPETRMMAYKYAVGENMDKVLEIQKKEWTRQQEEPPAQPSDGGSGRSSREGSGRQRAEGEAPPPEEVLSQNALDAINYRGITVDEYFRKMGYKGWKDHYQKRKDYYEGAQASTT